MRRLAAACALLALLTIVACDRRLIEEYEYNYAHVRINVDWESYFTERPTGMTVMLFDSTGHNPNTSVTNNIHTTTFTLGPGRYQLLIFNQSFDEFGSKRFEQTVSYDSIAARATNVTTHENEDWDRGVVYMREPEPIGVALDTFTISREMLNDYITIYPHQPITRSIVEEEDDGYYAVKDTAYLMTSTLYIYVLIKGMNNMRSVEGSITGMADGFRLGQIYRTQETATLLLDNWQTNQVSPDGREGWITTHLPTFGLPHGKETAESRKEEDNVITLHFTLRDGSTRDFTYNVGKYVKYRLESGHYVSRTTLELDLELIIEAPLFDVPELPDVTPSEGGGGGFDAHVDDWDDGGTIDIGM